MLLTFLGDFCIDLLYVFVYHPECRSGQNIVELAEQNLLPQWINFVLWYPIISWISASLDWQSYLRVFVARLGRLGLYRSKSSEILDLSEQNLRLSIVPLDRAMTGIGASVELEV